MNNYRLPNGESTKDGAEYIDAWTALAKPLMEATDTVMHGFDPHVLLRPRDYKGEIVQLPRWFLEAFNQGCKKGD